MEHEGDRGTAPDDRAYLEAEVVSDRLRAGAREDDPITRDAIALLGREFRAAAFGDASSGSRSGR